ncbi:MAG: hypothetical protein ACRCTL_08770 [Pseudomonas sp.]
MTFRQLLENSCRADEIFHAVPPESLLEQDDQSLKSYRLVHGHFNLAQTRHLTGFKKITTLRDPVARCLSAYNFWRGLDADSGDWPPAAQIKIRAAQSCTLAEMIQHPDLSIRHTFHNMQTRLLCGESDLQKSLGEEHLRRAQEELCLFDFIGLNSELELSMQLLCHKFDLFLPAHITALNSSKHKIQQDTATLKMLGEANQLDARLLDWANRRGPYRLNGMRGSGMLDTLKRLWR